MNKFIFFSALISFTLWSLPTITNDIEQGAIQPYNSDADASYMAPPNPEEAPPAYDPAWRPSTDFVETRNPLYTGNTAHETLDTSFGSVVFPPDPSDAESEASSDPHENHRDHRTESCRTRCWQSSACCKIKLVGAVVCATCLSLGVPSIIALATTS